MLNGIKHGLFNVVVGIPAHIAGSMILTSKGAKSVIDTSLFCLSLGRKERRMDSANRHTFQIAYFVPMLHHGVLEVLDPSLSEGPDLCPWVGTGGIFTRNVTHRLFRYGSVLSYSENSFLKKHIFSRILYITGAALSPATRVADFAIGVIASFVSIALFARCKPVNQIALQHLTVFGVIDDISLAARGIAATCFPVEVLRAADPL